MDDVARIVLAMEQHDIVEEVMHFLDRSGRARVVGTAADDRQLLEAVRQLEPDAVVAQPSLVGTEAARALAATLLAVDTRESVTSLRAAMRAGASGFFIWPGERDALSSAAAACMRSTATLDRRAVAVAVHAARGGSGVTFVATHLARAFARRGRACILIDGDPLGGEVGVAIGAPTEGVHTLGDLLPLLDELVPRHLEETLWTHPDGFRVLLAPPATEAASAGAAHLERVVDVAATVSDVVVLTLPRSLDGWTRAGLEAADRVVEVLSLDVLSFRATARAIEAFPPLGSTDRVGFAVNRAGRAEVTPGDVVRVFGRQPLGVIPQDRSVARAQDHGRLMPARGRVGRAFDRLARRLEEDPRPRAADP